MNRKTRLAFAFAFAAGLTAAGTALAQAQAASAPPWDASAQSAPWPQPGTLTIKPGRPHADQPTYSVDPPPEGTSGVYLPAAVLGYARSAAGCVVIGCEDGPHAGGAAEPPSPGPAEPPPPGLGQTDRR